nr:tyrosine-type recombinase/integrase [Gluconobacter cerinus]
MQLFDPSGARKYLTVSERTAFLKVAERSPRDVRTLAMTLAWSGCRLSEALALTADRVDLAGGVLVFESLKKRQDGIYRAVPVPPPLLEALDLVHGVREAQARRDRGRSLRLWPVARMTGWRMVHRVMAEAGLSGPAFRSISCRNGSAMPSSLPPPSMPTPPATRSRLLPGKCGTRISLKIV